MEVTCNKSGVNRERICSLTLPGNTQYHKHSDIAYTGGGHLMALSKLPDWQLPLVSTQPAFKTIISHCLPILPGNGCQLWSFAGSLGTGVFDYCLPNWSMVATLCDQSTGMSIVTGTKTITTTRYIRHKAGRQIVYLEYTIKWSTVQKCLTTIKINSYKQK